jgi:hypothetical protein
VRVHRWRDAATAGPVVREARLPVETVVTHGEGTDHAEGITLLGRDPRDPRARLLVVYDVPGPARRPWPDTLLADRVRIGDGGDEVGDEIEAEVGDEPADCGDVTGDLPDEPADQLPDDLLDDAFPADDVPADAPADDTPATDTDHALPVEVPDAEPADHPEPVRPR